jgi:hypothetical protein
LGYKDFVVDYEISSEDLNKHVIQYAYSKGDISWIGVGGNIGTGIFQPMCEDFHYIGSDWKELTFGSCVIKENKLYMDTTNVGYISRSKKVGNMSPGGIVAEAVRAFGKWGFDDIHTLNAITEYTKLTTEFMNIGKMVIYSIKMGENFHESLKRVIPFVQSQEEILQFDRMITTVQNLRSCGITTIANVRTNYSNLSYPILVSGNATMGDKIIIPKICDNAGRCIGICVSETIRKGICILPTKIYQEKPNPFSHIQTFTL